MNVGDYCIVLNQRAVFIGPWGNQNLFILMLPRINQTRYYLEFMQNNQTFSRSIDLKARRQARTLLVPLSTPVKVLGHLRTITKPTASLNHLISDWSRIVIIDNGTLPCFNLDTKDSGSKPKIKSVKRKKSHALSTKSEESNEFISPIWFSLKENLNSHRIKVGEVFELRDQQITAVLLSNNNDRVTWLPLYDSPIMLSSASEQREMLKIIKDKAPKHARLQNIWTLIDSKRLIITNHSLYGSRIGDIESDSLKIIQVNLAVRRTDSIRAQKSARPETKQLESFTISPFIREKLCRPIINVQEVFELVQRYPDFLKAAIGSCSSFEQSTFMFRDTDGKLIVYQLDHSGAIEFVSSNLNINMKHFSALVLAFLNSNNTTCELYFNPEIGPSSPSKNTRYNSQPGFQYKILHINPIPSRYKPENKSASDHNRPARLVRGHFVTYTKERPLFGKPWGVGTFWIGPYVSGNPEFGIIIKDYHISLKEFINVFHLS